MLLSIHRFCAIQMMPGDSCVVCGNSRAKAPELSYHRFPSDQDKRALWLQVFQIAEEQLKAHHRVCSRHFRDGDPEKGPDVSLGKRFASPMKKGAPRTKRAKQRQLAKESAANLLSAGSGSLVVSLPLRTVSVPSPSPPPIPEPPLVVVPGEQLEVDYQVHELPSDRAEGTAEQTSPGPSTSTSGDQSLVNMTLLARIEVLEAENVRLKTCLSNKRPVPFGIDQIKHDDRLISFYTGFSSYTVLMAFFHFLGPAVDKLHYWGTMTEPRKRHRLTKISPLDLLLMTLVKLRLNLKVKDLAFRFGVSSAAVSRYFTTWVCFLYQHLKEIDWMPTVEQISGTLPPAFREHYPSTYAIIDGSEIFMETPTDLYMQSSTWSSYKHHNTAKFLIACTPNGCISFISPLYVGSISDVELTRVSGLLESLQNKAGISVMADRGFTIKDMLQDIGVELNIPPFMEGRQRLPAKEVREGRQIASVRIHVERAIGRIKTFSILKQTLPISLARISNQIVCVCAYLSNFKPVLVPGETLSIAEEGCDEVDDYFEELSDTDESDEEYSQ